MSDQRMYVSINKINLRDDRLRKEVGDLEELGKSLEKVQIHDIIIDEKWDIRIGTRRYLAAKKKGIKHVWVRQKFDLDEDEWLWLEAEENLRRKNLSITEELVAEAKAKELFEKLYPETKAGVSQAIGMNISLSHNVVTKLTPTLNDKEVNFKNDHESSGLINSDDKIGLRESYIKQRAKSSRFSESTIKRNVRLGKAILEGRVSKEEQVLLDKREISKQKVLNRLREDKKKKLELYQNRILSPYESPEIFRKSQPKLCEDCEKAEKSFCPECKKGILICRKYKNLMIKDIDSEACEDFE
ncbi:hypothetical protein LCGC14_0320810 [marine sediment metagenome]|uniref:ParB/Sulfiredoxin domain-containing protein n=1 Tax=marine sediment metagenome TaxID=412755 RepID=A0A0F9TPV4_9ZZZZ